jgi:hypothetical protein
MAPNLALLTLTPELTGVAAAATRKSSRLYRFYAFLRATQSRRAGDAA